MPDKPLSKINALIFIFLSGLISWALATIGVNMDTMEMVPVYIGRGFGQIELDRKIMPPGNYTLRAYTNWMRNFGEKYICRYNFTISGTKTNEWLVNYSTQVKKTGDEESIQLHMKVKQLDSIPVQLNLRVPIKEKHYSGMK